METERMNVKYLGKPCYDIALSDSFEQLAAEWDVFQEKERKICVITDEHVKELYGDEVLKVLKQKTRNVSVYAFPEGEQSKTLETVQAIYTFLIEKGFDRNDVLVALGGGVVGDITGFCAATYMRGIAFVQIPTTLLAQVDSSIGGKTGVDFQEYKNMVGAFYMPKMVYINISVLQTLEERQYYSGFAEVMKSALIKDSIFYEWLIDRLYEIGDRDTDTLIEMVQKCCNIKKMVVEKDPEEKGERAILNFGHTIGHAIEKYYHFTKTHGECVALGCVAAAFLSWRKNWLSKEEYYEIRDMFVPFHLPISIDDADIDEIIQLTKSDKKMDGDSIRFILLKKVGKAVIDPTITAEDMREALQELVFSEE